MVKLGVNIDHVATLRQARLTYEPDPVHAAAIVQLAGADGVTIHLREDRRHIQDRDLRLLKETVHTFLNLEMALSDEIIKIALEICPDQVTIVPEKRQEITTEGGLDVRAYQDKLKETIPKFLDKGINVSLFIDPKPEMVYLSKEVGAPCVELHTGSYANSSKEKVKEELEKLKKAAECVIESGMILNAGHGLNYRNVREIAAIPGMNELNIGHSIISRAVFVGLAQAVKEMKYIIQQSSSIKKF